MVPFSIWLCVRSLRIWMVAHILIARAKKICRLHVLLEIERKNMTTKVSSEPTVDIFAMQSPSTTHVVYIIACDGRSDLALWDTISQRLIQKQAHGSAAWIRKVVCYRVWLVYFFYCLHISFWGLWDGVEYLNVREYINQLVEEWMPSLTSHPEHAGKAAKHLAVAPWVAQCSFQCLWRTSLSSLDLCILHIVFGHWPKSWYLRRLCERFRIFQMAVIVEYDTRVDVPLIVLRVGLDQPLLLMVKLNRFL